MEPEDETLRPDELLAQLGWVRALARSLVADPEVTDDVLQQVCLLALQQAPREASEGPRLRAWLATVTRNLSRHAARSDLRRHRRERAAARPEALPATDELAAHREALRRLVEALTALEEPYYSVVVARYFDGREVADIAALTGSSPAAVRQQLSRARQQLRARLQSLLADDRGRWLSATLPLSSVPASIQSAPAKSLLSHFGGFVVAKSAPAVVAAIAVGVALTGAVIYLRSDERSGAAAPSMAQVLPGAADATRGGRPDLSGLERDKPARPATGAAAASSPAPKPADDRLALPAVPASQAWDGLFKAADDLAAGTMTQEGIVNLAFDLLAQLPVDAKPQIANGLATYDLLDSPGFGKVRLTVRLDTSKNDAANAMAPSAFAIDADLETRPGAFTGNAADNAKSTNVAIKVNTDDRDALQSLSAVSQNMVGGSKELWAQMNASGQTVVVGGALNITSDSGTWRALNVQASGTADNPGFLHTAGEPVEKPGRLAEPRTQLLNDVLASRRRSVPR